MHTILLPGRHLRFVYLAAVCLLATPLFAKTVTLKGADNHTSVCLTEGDTLIVILASPMPDTYRWKIQSGTFSPLTAVREFEAPGAEKTGKTQSFRFNAASGGKTTLTFRLDLVALLDGPKATPQTFSADITIASGETKSSVLIGTYEGTTECADCTGIQTRLRLYAKGMSDFTDTIYVMTRTYLGGRNGDQSFTELGEWAVLRGDANDPNATVYELNPGQPEQAQFLLLQPGAGALTELDRQMKPVGAPPQYQSILKRME